MQPNWWNMNDMSTSIFQFTAPLQCLKHQKLIKLRALSNWEILKSLAKERINQFKRHGFQQQYGTSLESFGYIKYINITFPLKLDTYFDIFQLITTLLVQYLGLNNLLSKIKWWYGSICGNNLTYFLSNFIIFPLSFILAYSNYFLLLFVQYTLYVWAMGSKQTKFNFPEDFSQNQHKVLIFYYSALMRIFLANYYDIMFAACIQVNNLNWENVNMSINSGLSILVLGGQAYFIFNIASKLTSFINRTTISNKVKYDSIFEGVQDNNANFWGMQLNSILLLKKFMFMVIIVNCQGDGAIQTMYVSISSTMYLAYLIKTKPFNSKSELIKQIINESSLSFNALTFMVYKYQRLLQLEHSEAMIMGWIHIVSFSGILCSTLIIDLYNQMQNIFNKLRSQLQKKDQEPAPLFY